MSILIGNDVLERAEQNPNLDCPKCGWQGVASETIMKKIEHPLCNEELGESFDTIEDCLHCPDCDERLI